MKSTNIQFTNKRGITLSAPIDFPVEQDPHSFAIFSHCFTCNKNFSTVRNVSHALASQGFGLLRFDFTGLGDSGGDFSDTNFTSNVAYLISAANYLTENYKAPSLIVGHSLGGATAIIAAEKIDSRKAVSTIGVPSNPAHVQKQLEEDNLEIIKKKGQADVKLAGRDFTFKKQFIDHLKTSSCVSAARYLNKALLILHSPQDATVSIKNAEEIYHDAQHPKSFVTLDGSEHLLINKKDASYVGDIIAGWIARYLPAQEKNVIKTSSQVTASLDDQNDFTTHLKLGSHYLTADEPSNIDGNNYGPTPYELITASLSACTAITIQMYVKRKGWKLDNVTVHTNYSKSYPKDCSTCLDDTSTKIDTFTRVIKLTSDSLDE